MRPVESDATKKLLLHARSKYHKPYAGYQQRYRDRRRDLQRFVFVYGWFDGTDFGHFFLLVVVENRVDESNHTEDQEDDSDDDDHAFHSSEPITTGATWAKNACGHTPAPGWRLEYVDWITETYERLAAAAVAAAAFLAALAPVAAFPRP